MEKALILTPDAGELARLIASYELAGLQTYPFDSAAAALGRVGVAHLQPPTPAIRRRRWS